MASGTRKRIHPRAIGIGAAASLFTGYVSLTVPNTLLDAIQDSPIYAAESASTAGGGLGALLGVAVWKKFDPSAIPPRQLVIKSKMVIDYRTGIPYYRDVEVWKGKTVAQAEGSSMIMNLGKIAGLGLTGYVGGSALGWSPQSIDLLQFMQAHDLPISSTLSVLAGSLAYKVTKRPIPNRPSTRISQSDEQFEKLLKDVSSDIARYLKPHIPKYGTIPPGYTFEGVVEKSVRRHKHQLKSYKGSTRRIRKDFVKNFKRTFKGREDTIPDWIDTEVFGRPRSLFSSNSQVAEYTPTYQVAFNKALKELRSRDIPGVSGEKPALETEDRTTDAVTQKLTLDPWKGRKGLEIPGRDSDRSIVEPEITREISRDLTRPSGTNAKGPIR